MKTISLGDIISDDGASYVVTNFIDCDGEETEDGFLAISIVAKGEDGWHVFTISQLEPRIGH
jgi:hypothetical protein